MKKLAIGLAFLGACSIAFAAPVTVSSVTQSGGNNSASLISNGAFPAEYYPWDWAMNVWWTGTSVALSMTFDGVYELRDARLSVDNNDSYRVDYSMDGSSWTPLFSVLSGYGNVTWGMDTMSTVAGDGEYVAQIDFGPVDARYARIVATGGDNYYSVGELSFSGNVANRIPEPVSLALMGVGLLGLGLVRRRK